MVFSLQPISSPISFKPKSGLPTQNRYKQTLIYSLLYIGQTSKETSFFLIALYSQTNGRNSIQFQFQFQREREMSSSCISSSCVNEDAHVPVRASYENLYKWPESDADFVRSVSSSAADNKRSSSSRVVDSVSFRQMYLRSYPFSKKESVTRNYFGRVKERVVCSTRQRKTSTSGTKGVVGGGRRRRRYCIVVIRKVKKMTRAALFSFLNRFLSCSIT